MSHAVNALSLTVVLSLLWSSGRRDIPASSETRPVCGLMGTVRLVAGKFSTKRKKILFQPTLENMATMGCMWCSAVSVRHVPGCHHEEEEGGRSAGPCCVEGSGL